MSKSQIGGHPACRRVRLVGTRAESDLSGWEGSMAMVDPGAHSPGVQRASSATSTSKFDNIGGWVGLEGITSLPVRRDFPSTRLEQQPSYDLAVALSTTGRTIILSNLNKRLGGRAGGSLNQEKPPPFGYQVERPVQPWRDDDDRHLPDQ